MNKYFLMFGEDFKLYNELPVDIDTFIESSNYIGNYTKNGERIYPFWREQLRKMFDLKNPNRYFQMVNATALGTGKTKVSMIAFSYMMYVYMCLKDINSFFHFRDTDECAFAIASVGKDYAEQSRDVLFEIIKDSHWFNCHGSIDLRKREYIPINGLKIVTVWKPEDTYGRQFLCSQFSYLCDNYNGRNTWDLYKVINERTLSRAYLNDTIYGKHFVDFEMSNNSLNIALVNLWKKTEHTFCITGSQWDVKPAQLFDMKNPFAILYDGTLGHSKIIDLIDPEKISDYYGKSTNHDGKIKCIVCPSDFRKCAELGVDKFLLDVAGIQLKRNANYNLPLKDAFNELMSGKAIMFDGDDYYFALRDDKSVCVYDKNTNREEWTITNFVLAFGNKASKYILSDRWMSFDNPLKSNQKGDEQDE